ncbi:glycosyltransferase family 4 protein [Egbenema bharatensis]|uniref:glycosyltransferase family 4 protein n=1 Tax=Egbenema bharatensis TaxID=3463334 RepID=UPI003A85BCDF
MKILMSAYACEPNRGSEEGVGWNIVVQAAKQHEVWVLTRTFYRSAIEAELEKQHLSNLHFIYFDPFNWSSDWRDTQGPVQFHYYLWQIQAYFVGRSLHQQVDFDLIQHVTYGKYWSPSFLSLLPAPFIWGPIGGGDAAPKPFWKDFSFRGKLYETVRSLAQGLGALDPFTQMTARRSQFTLAATHGTAERAHKLGSHTVKVISQVGLSDQEIQLLQNLDIAEQPVVRFVSIGRLLHWKGFHLGLRAFAQANIPNAEYWFFGDGAEKSRLEALAASLGIESKVRFWGRMARESMFTQLEQCHVLVHPSLHEAGGFVCAEMMAAGRPVICLDLGGPAIQVTEATGMKIPAHDPDQTVQDMAEAMQRLAIDSDLRLRLGKAAQQRVKDTFRWDAVGQTFAHIYEQVM